MIRRAERVSTRDALLAVEERGGRLFGAIVAPAPAGVDVVRAGSVPRSEELATDLRALADLLATPATRPRTAIVLSEQVTAVSLRVPPTAGLGPERMTSLVRWELEPFLGQAAAGVGLACGWTERRGGADAPLFACGLPAPARAELVATFKAAGLRLEAVYPALGCAAAVAGDAVDAVVIEVPDGGERMACTRLENGQVARYSVVRSDPSDPFVTADACAALAEGASRVVLAGPVREEVLDGLGARAYERAGHLAADPLGQPVSASLLGAAQHAFRLPGGERVPVVAARDPRPALWSIPAVRAGAAAVLALAAVVGVDLEVGRRVGAARLEADLLEQKTAAARTDAAALAALRQRASSLTTERDALATTLAAAERDAGSAAQARALLEALALATPDDLAIDAVRADERGLVIQGFALSPLSVQRFVRDLALALEPMGQQRPQGHQVQRRKGRLGVDGCWFEARFGGVR